MKVDLEKPYSDLYKTGYLRKCKDGRKRLDLVSLEGGRTTTSYARYLLTVSIGEFLDDFVDVDHIDGDKTNDSLDNLQILSKEEHLQKTLTERPLGRTTKVFVCPVCDKEFERELRQVKKGSTPKCSRRCNGLFSRLNSGWGR